MRYIILFAALLVAACSHGEAPNPLGPCDDKRMAQACDNWNPGYVAVCYAERPDVQPNPSCGWLPSNRFGAPDPMHLADDGGQGESDWWCCSEVM